MYQNIGLIYLSSPPMISKDSQIHESLTMDNNHRIPTATTAIPQRHSLTLSYTAFILLLAFFVCTTVAVGFITYNFITCDQLVPAENENIVCTTVKNKTLTRQLEIEAEAAKRRKHGSIRLPRSLKPLRYNISLVTYLDGNFTFDGHTQIRILVLEDCFNITMHALELNISKNDAYVWRAGTADNPIDLSNTARETGGLRIRKQYLFEEKQFFIIELYDKLEKGAEYIVELKFRGLLNDYLQGLYRSFYNVGKEKRWLASTQFQATDARRAFPCFDEPGLKARFTLNVAHPANMSAISNMPIIATRKHESLKNYVWDHFAESVPMSTYLIALAITDFKHLTIENFSVWARDEAIDAARYALKVGPEILKFLEKYFDLKFPLPKIDMIALPDFQAGAMENWGLITYRETAMLYDEGIAAKTNKQRIASVVGHELAHQWFGNLVTPAWWSDLWLNEGFASYMEYLTVDAVEPEWRTLDQFVVNELQAVFQLDALSSSHEISVEVSDPEEITEIFDRISYAKGSTIIRMMSHFLTSKVFRSGLSKYLKGMSYSSAEQDDLWRYLTNEAVAHGLLDKSTSVKDIMDTWTLQVGYPVLDIKRDPHTHVIRMEQSRFVFVNETDKQKNKTSPLWWIPISFTTSSELNFQKTRPTTWIPRSKVYEIESRNLSTAEWFIFNIQQTGYYRCNYELENWKAITSHLMSPAHHTEIAPANRAQLIDDALNLARGGYLPYDVAMNLTRYLVHELDYVPWKAATTAFNFLDSMFVNQGDYDLLKNYFLRSISKVYNDIGFEDDQGTDDDIVALFKRVEILNLACHLGHRECISESIRHFQNWIQVPNPDANNPIAPNLRGIVYCSAIQYGTEYEWDFAFERYIKTSVSAEKEILLNSLGCSKEPWLLFRYLRRAISGNSIRKQDVYRVFVSVSSNVVGQQIVFDFIRSNWKEIKAYLGSSLSDLNTIIKYATKRMNTKFLLNELESFIGNDLKETGFTIQQSIEQVRVNVNWMDKNYKSIVKWLKNESATV